MAPMISQVSPTTATTTLPTSLPPMTASGEATEPIHMPTTTAPIMLQTGSIPNTNSESNVKLPSSIDLSQFDFSSDDSQNGKKDNWLKFIPIYYHWSLIIMPAYNNNACPKQPQQQVISIICSGSFNPTSRVLHAQIMVSSKKIVRYYTCSWFPLFTVKVTRVLMIINIIIIFVIDGWRERAG